MSMWVCSHTDNVRDDAEDWVDEHADHDCHHARCERPDHHQHHLVLPGQHCGQRRCLLRSAHGVLLSAEQVYWREDT